MKEKLKQNIIQQAFFDAQELLHNFCTNQQNFKKVGQISELLADAFNNKQKILICGNGGSYCDAMHFAEEFTAQFRKPRRALPVIVLSDPSHITCVGNDFGFDDIFARGVEAYGTPQDWLIVLSTSGNSPNIIKAVKTAQSLQLNTIALLGKNGGALKNICNHEIIIPGKTSDRIQELHMLILHVIIEGVERILSPENYNYTITKKCDNILTAS